MLETAAARAGSGVARRWSGSCSEWAALAIRRQSSGGAACSSGRSDAIDDGAAAETAAQRRREALQRRGLDDDDLPVFGALAEHRPPWEHPPPEVGLAGMADRAVSRSVQQGAFDSLRGAGKPLPCHARHDEQFFTVDATQQAINRLLKHNNFKPPSLELKEDLDLEEQSLHAILHAKAATADGARTTLAAASCAATAAALARVNALIGRYNAAVLSDRETYGARWPLPTRSPVALDELWRVTVQRPQRTEPS